jgi:ATP-dependent DNA helicase RecG
MLNVSWLVAVTAKAQCPMTCGTAQLSLFEQQSPDLELESPDLSVQGPDLRPSSPDLSRDAVFTEADRQRWIELKEIAKPIATASGRKVKAEVEQVIIALCDKAAPHRLKLANIAELLDMKSDTLRKNYLSQMVKEQRLFLAYPTIANHPEQGYTTQKDA